jgi:hypothetical protein
MKRTNNSSKPPNFATSKPKAMNVTSQVVAAVIACKSGDNIDKRVSGLCVGYSPRLRVLPK